MAARARALVSGSTRADRLVVALLAAATGVTAGGLVAGVMTVVALAPAAFAVVVGAGKQTAA